MNRDSKQVLTEFLVFSAQNGCESAFKELHDLWRADLQRFCFSRVQRSEAVGEITNDAWLAIARRLHRIDDPASFPRWAFRIVERRCADWIRTRMRDRRREAAVAQRADEVAPTSAIEPQLADDVLRLREVLPGLPQEHRELLHLYYFAERSVAEIADALGVPVGTVKSRLFSLRESLKQQLERKTS